MPKRHQTLSSPATTKSLREGSLSCITASELLSSVFTCLAASALLDFQASTRLAVVSNQVRRCLRNARIDVSEKAVDASTLPQMLRFWRVIGVNVRDCAEMLPGCIHLRAAILRRGSLVDVSALGQCSSLQTVDLSECGQLTDVSALGQCSSLQTV
jgi:hypothetical protein